MKTLIDSNLPRKSTYESKHLLHVESVVASMPGGSQSKLVQCDDGKLYVLKMLGNPQGSNVLANEALGALLMRGLGIATPDYQHVQLTLSTLRKHPELRFQHPQGSYRPDHGIHFASEYLAKPGFDICSGNADPARQLARLDSRQRAGISLFDTWASHCDTRQEILRVNKETGSHECFYIDNGHLFGGPKWSRWSLLDRQTVGHRLSALGVYQSHIGRWIAHFRDTLPTLLSRSITAIHSSWHLHSLRRLEKKLLARLSDLCSWCSPDWDRSYPSQHPLQQLLSADLIKCFLSLALE